MFDINFCRWLDSNRGLLVSEATALPTEPQPLPLFVTFKLLDSPRQIFARLLDVRVDVVDVNYFQSKASGFRQSAAPRRSEQKGGQNKDNSEVRNHVPSFFSKTYFFRSRLNLPEKDQFATHHFACLLFIIFLFALYFHKTVSM